MNEGQDAQLSAVELTPSEAHFANQDEYPPHECPPSIPMWLHDHGVPVFPLKVGTKEPLVLWKAHRSTRDQARSLTHYGIWLRDLLVVDADCPAAAAWMRAHCPATPFRVTTGPYHDGSSGRGEHWYFRL